MATVIEGRSGQVSCRDQQLWKWETGEGNINTGSKVDNARNRLRGIPANQDNHAAGDQDDQDDR